MKNETTLTAYIESLKTPAIPETAAMTAARAAIVTAKNDMDMARSRADFEAFAKATAEKAAAEKALDKASARAPKAERISAGHIMANLICKQGWTFSGTSGEVDEIAAAVCYVLEQTTGERPATAATRTTSGALIKAARLGYLQTVPEAASIAELRQCAAAILAESKENK